MQVTQSQRPPLPGHPAQDFQTHLQQQLQGNVGQQSIAAPTPKNPSQQQALQELQSHIEWYQQSFGNSPQPHNPQTSSSTLNQPTPSQMSPIKQMHQLPMRIQTPMSQGQAHTVPNTPQQYTQSWPSPPTTTIKHGRSQSYQLDVAPMPMASTNTQDIIVSNAPFAHPSASFTQEPIGSMTEQHYASSNYSSSVVDPMSPGQQLGGPLPTLFEDPVMHTNMSHQAVPDDALLLEAAAGAEDFGSPNYMMGGMSPHTAALHSLGEGVNCSIMETGISTAQVNSYIYDTGRPQTMKYQCTWIDENGKTCDKTFGRHENASSHVQNHLGDRKFQCNDCSKTFVRAHDMKRHAAIHQPDRPHICPCGQGFARHDALTRHRQRGMCKGTLPGYEKSEADKPKRGRPKKQRPDQKTRTDKAKKARAIDAANATEEGASQPIINYASSSSVISEHSLPMTPPDASDMDADAFFNLAEASDDNVMMNGAINWNDTPPTSPVSSSPMKTIDNIATISPNMLSNRSSPSPTMPGAGMSFEGCSSPIMGGNNMQSDFEYGVIDAQPGVAQQDLFSDAFSPSHYAGSDHSSPLNGSTDDLQHASYGKGTPYDAFQLVPSHMQQPNVETRLDVLLQDFLSGDM